MEEKADINMHDEYYEEDYEIYQECEAHNDQDDESSYVQPQDNVPDPSWVKNGTDVPIDVRVNNVEYFLLEKAIEEADHVFARTANMICGKTKIPHGYDRSNEFFGYTAIEHG